MNNGTATDRFSRQTSHYLCLTVAPVHLQQDKHINDLWNVWAYCTNCGKGYMP